MASIQMNVVAIQSIIDDVQEMTIKVGVEVGSKTSDNGKVSPVYATVVIPCRIADPDMVLTAMHKMGKTPLKVSIPRLVTGKLSIQLKAVMRADDFAKLCGYKVPADGQLVN